jgi:hypothetical protein
VDAGRFEQIGRRPPDREAQGVGEMILPKSFPGRAAVRKYPAIHDEKSQNGSNLTGDESRNHVGPTHDADHKLQHEHPERRKAHANDEPFYDLRGDKFLQALHLGRNSFRARRFRRVRVTQKRSGQKKNRRLGASAEFLSNRPDYFFGA